MSTLEQRITDTINAVTDGPVKVALLGRERKIADFDGLMKVYDTTKAELDEATEREKTLTEDKVGLNNIIVQRDRSIIDNNTKIKELTGLVDGKEEKIKSLTETLKTTSEQLQTAEKTIKTTNERLQAAEKAIKTLTDANTELDRNYKTLEYHYNTLHDKFVTDFESVFKSKNADTGTVSELLHALIGAVTPSDGVKRGDIDVYDEDDHTVANGSPTPATGTFVPKTPVTGTPTPAPLLVPETPVSGTPTPAPLLVPKTPVTGTPTPALVPLLVPEMPAGGTPTPAPKTPTIGTSVNGTLVPLLLPKTPAPTVPPKEIYFDFNTPPNNDMNIALQDPEIKKLHDVWRKTRPNPVIFKAKNGLYESRTITVNSSKYIVTFDC